LGSKSILPGLIDCHVHLRSDGLADPRAQQAGDTDAVALLRSARNARRTLECGVTTIRDCGSRGGIDFALRTASQQGLCPTPRLVLSGLIVCMTGGHGWQLGHEADGPDAVRRAARTRIKLGADNVKLIASGGIRRPIVATRIERRAAAAAMAVADFAAGAVRDFVQRADDERWLQLLTIMRKAENPGLAAIQAILGWVAADA
jgi:imidazolonepropionase-like amidohydrolase